MTVPAQLAPYLFKQGNPGKQAGTIHKQDRIAREILERCFTDIGGYEAMVAWAKVNKTAFYTKLWSKFIVTAAASLPEDDKLELLKSMLIVPRVLTQVFDGEVVQDAQTEPQSQVATEQTAAGASTDAPVPPIPPPPDPNHAP